jgi:hypothetical protein
MLKEKTPSLIGEMGFSLFHHVPASCVELVKMEDWLRFFIIA